MSPNQGLHTDQKGGRNPGIKLNHQTFPPAFLAGEAQAVGEF